jgi:hypothetical protein
MPVFGESRKRNYEGLNATSIGLWRKWLELYEDRFESFEYNVRIGQGIAAPAGISEEWAKIWQMLTQKRIDVVGERENQTWVIEIEERPGARTFGQVGLYLYLLPRYRKVREVLMGAVVSARMGFDMASAFRGNQILYFTFPASGYPKLPPQFLPSTQTPLWYPGAV